MLFGAGWPPNRESAGAAGCDGVEATPAAAAASAGALDDEVSSAIVSVASGPVDAPCQ